MIRFPGMIRVSRNDQGLQELTGLEGNMRVNRNDES